MREDTLLIEEKLSCCCISFLILLSAQQVVTSSDNIECSSVRFLNPNEKAATNLHVQVVVTRKIGYKNQGTTHTVR